MSETPMNLIVIIADTLRRDHIGVYGNKRIRTPNLDKLGAQSLIFDNLFAGSFPTVPARGDFLTGRYTFATSGWGPLLPNLTTLPEAISSTGNYLTTGIVDTPFYVRNGYGYDRGFQDFIWTRGQRRGAERYDVIQDWRLESDRFVAKTMAEAEKWLEKHYKERFFLLVDTWDPHEPWCAPGHYVEEYLPNYDGSPAPWPCYWYWAEAGLSEDDLHRAHAHYCAEVTLVDRWIGKVIERLESLRLLQNTMVIFFSDHGFYFGEHGGMLGKAMMRSEESGYVVGIDGDTGDGAMRMLFRSPDTGKVGPGVAKWWRSPLYDEVTRVPLMIFMPGAKSRRITERVSIPDLMPTILELLSIDIIDGIQGSSFAGLVKGNMTERPSDMTITSWPLYNPGEKIRVVDDWARTVAEPLPSTINTENWSFVYSVTGEKMELYHRPSDPNLEKNVIAENVDVAKGLHARFVSFLESAGADERLIDRRRQFS